MAQRSGVAECIRHSLMRRPRAKCALTLSDAVNDRFRVVDTTIVCRLTRRPARGGGRVRGFAAKRVAGTAA